MDRYPRGIPLGVCPWRDVSGDPPGGIPWGYRLGEPALPSLSKMENQIWEANPTFHLFLRADLPSLGLGGDRGVSGGATPGCPG